MSTMRTFKVIWVGKLFGSFFLILLHTLHSIFLERKKETRFLPSESIPANKSGKSVLQKIRLSF